MGKQLESRFDLYSWLERSKTEFLEEANRVGSSIGIPSELQGQIGPTGANSALPATMSNRVLSAIDTGMRKVQSCRELGDEIRRLVKSVYGDDYDAAPTNSCESALAITYDALLAPPSSGHGEPYRSRVIGLLERHAEHQLSYGRPFPPQYKDIFGDRGATAGEFGLLGRRREMTDCVMVKPVGARFDLHGLKFHPAPLLMGVQATPTIESVARAARIHAPNLAGFVSLGYDTPGCGYGEHDENGTPLLARGLGALAAEYGVPYIADNAWGMPFVGTDPRRTGADIILYSMDKVTGAPTSGLMIGREWSMVPIRRALGIQGERFGTTSSHGKGSHVFADPGKMAMLGMVEVLRTLRDEPTRVTDPIDLCYDLVVDEFGKIKGELPEGLMITKSYNLGGVELNYQNTWDNPRGWGIPIFTNEDRVAGSHLLALALTQMGILAGPAEDGNILVNPGLGTTDENGELIEANMRFVVRGVFKTLVLLNDWINRSAV